MVTIRKYIPKKKNIFVDIPIYKNSTLKSKVALSKFILKKKFIVHRIPSPKIAPNILEFISVNILKVLINIPNHNKGSVILSG